MHPRCGGVEIRSGLDRLDGDRTGPGEDQSIPLDETRPAQDTIRDGEIPVAGCLQGHWSLSEGLRANGGKGEGLGALRDGEGSV